MAKIYKDTKKVTILVETGLDLTGATILKLLVKKPDGRPIEWIPTAVTPITRGNLTYTTNTSNDLDVAGTYLVQAYVEKNGGVYYGETAQFVIYERYK